MILFQILDLPLLVDQLTLLVFKLFLGDDPVVVYPLTLLLEICQELLLLLESLLQVTQLFAHRQLKGGQDVP